MNKPHKSTTHDELFFHVENRGTVFFRKEDDGVWNASYALRDPRDQFCRKTGRCVARRKYFQGKKSDIVALERPNYNSAEGVIEYAEYRRLVRH